MVSLDAGRVVLDVCVWAGDHHGGVGLALPFDDVRRCAVRAVHLDDRAHTRRLIKVPAQYNQPVPDISSHLGHLRNPGFLPAPDVSPPAMR